MSENIEIIKQFYAQHGAYAFNRFYIQIITHFCLNCKKNNFYKKFLKKLNDKRFSVVYNNVRKILYKEINYGRTE